MMRFKCKITMVDFKQYNCTTDLIIENVEGVIFKECGDCPMVEIVYYTLDARECHKIMPTRGINCIDMEEQ